MQIIMPENVLNVTKANSLKPQLSSLTRGHSKMGYLDLDLLEDEDDEVDDDRLFRRLSLDDDELEEELDEERPRRRLSRRWELERERELDLESTV